MAISKSTFAGQVVNVANGKQITIAEVAETVKRHSITEKKISFNNAERKGDPINWEADISLLKAWGYVQKVSLDEGVKKYIEWIRDIK